jgi:hypothetical protein
MSSFRIAVVPLLLATGLALAALPDERGITDKVKAKPREVWTSASDPTLPADFKVQGEYVGAIQGGGKVGAQVIALGDGAFQAVICPGGLPGAGWDGKNKVLLAGKISDEGGASFEPAKGKRRYLARKPDEFSATAKFPPAGQKEYKAKISDGVMTGQTDDGKTFELKKTTRESPTLGKSPPANAIVLFDGTNIKEWTAGRLDKKTSLLNTDGRDIRTKRKFNNYTAHVEFLLPYRPRARGQGRGNSGFYQVDQYEVQILDSFGLEGKDNECGGIYSLLAPKVNMCLPPLVWQTYDVEFTNAVRDESGKKVKNTRITLKHNGVVVHDNAELKSVTGGARAEPEGTPGPLQLQGHGNPLQFRNIWVVEKK